MLPVGEPVAFSNHGVGVPRRQEVIFEDGHAVWLDQVQTAGSADLFKRRIRTDAGDVTEIDLRRLAPELEKDLPIAATRDVPGVVFYSLRQVFKTQAAFLAAAGAVQ